jgi:ribosomal protein S18
VYIVEPQFLFSPRPLQDLNPFVPAETSQFSPASRRIEAPRPSAAEALAGADFRNVPFLARFMTETGRISPRRRSGLQVTAGGLPPLLFLRVWDDILAGSQCTSLVWGASA